jgi:hypothetical protein
MIQPRPRQSLLKFEGYFIRKNAGEQVSPVIATGSRRAVIAWVSREAGFCLEMVPKGGNYRNFNLKTGIMVHYWRY